MKVQTIKNSIIDQYGNKYIHRIKTKKNKTTEFVTLNDQPMQKAILKDGKVRIFDMGLFGQWIERKQS